MLWGESIRFTPLKSMDSKGKLPRRQPPKAVPATLQSVAGKDRWMSCPRWTMDGRSSQTTGRGWRAIGPALMELGGV